MRNMPEIDKNICGALHTIDPWTKNSLLSQTYDFLSCLDEARRSQDIELSSEKDSLAQQVHDHLDILMKMVFDSTKDIDLCLQDSIPYLFGTHIVETHKLSGWGGAPVLLISGDNIKLVVKVFEQSTKTKHWYKLHKEAFSLNFVNKLDVLEHASFPKLLGLSVCSFKDAGFILLYQEFIEGDTLKSYIEEIKNHPSNTESRKLALEEASNVMLLFGKGLREFHYVKSIQNLEPIPKATLNLYKNIASEAITKLKRIGAQIDLTKLQELFEARLTEVEQHQSILGITHGDAHFDNFLIQKTGNQAHLKIIDVIFVYDSLDSGLKPTGLAARDYFFTTNFYFNLMELIYAKIGHKTLTKQEREILINNISLGYGDAIPITQMKKFKDFFLLLEHLLLIKRSFDRHLTAENCDDEDKMEKYFCAGTMIVLDRIKKDVNDF